ncbi:PEPxxWA-CTERM sorting domain-containing protein [Sphingomonas kaistensis]|uniref:PEPxxWA-CTERM sorting domain-containing protein n=1 Tax=Sphingomonas kaistensis TaxID=298708 RepID=A0ABZ2G1P1_9SPHN
MRFAFLAATAALFSAGSAMAQITPGEKTITNLNSPFPAGQSFAVTEASGGGSGNITTQNVSDTDGSLNITGDRVRVQTGNQFGGGTNTGVSANSIVDLTGDFFINALGDNRALTPALRVLIQDGSQRSELIWEGAYNGSTGLGFGSADAGDLFYQFIAGQGATPGNTFGYTMMSLADWGNTYSSAAFVSALSIGVGGAPGVTGFNANVDNFAFRTDAGTTRYNFATSAVAAVPEPGTWALMLVGFGAIGGSMRRSRRSAKAIPQIA